MDVKFIPIYYVVQELNTYGHSGETRKDILDYMWPPKILCIW